MKPLLLALALVCPAVSQSNGNPVEEGRFLYRSNCAFCHGITGGGGRGPALARGNFQHGSTNEDIARVIRNGIPGTNMPAFEMEKDELENLVQFLRAISGGGRSERVPGDAAQGRQVYLRSGCAGCHRIGNEGSVFGPDLTRIGAARSAAYIRDSILHPSADIPEDFEGVTVVMRDGRRISGLRINEDTFSIQLRDQSQKFRMFQKSDLREIVYEKNSLMPAYASLSGADLQNLLAYLDSLRGEANRGAEVRKAEGIR